MRIDGLLICAVCDKPVEKMQVYDEALTDTKVFTAYCHGETERQVLTSFFMLNADKINFVRAFERPVLEKNNG
jgi:hypothetical protein